MSSTLPRSAFARLPLSAVPVALVLSVLLYVQGRLGAASIALQIAPLSIVFALIARSSKYICRAIPIRRGRIRRAATVHAAASVVSAGLWSLFAAAFGWALAALTGDWVVGIDRGAELFVIFAVGGITYLWSATGCYLTMAVEDAVRAENRAVEAQCLALDAELKALRAKLHPHFLFNSLNSIAALTAIDPERAREMCIHLSDFLRHSLSFSNKREIRLKEELDLVRAYLAVEQIRFSEKMTVRENIEDGADACIVPPLLLQPLAENAVKYGVAGMAKDGYIDLRVTKLDARLQIRIENPVDAARPKSRGTGHGLAIVRERLTNLFGDAAHMTASLRREPSLVFVTELSLPVRKESTP